MCLSFFALFFFFLREKVSKILFFFAFLFRETSKKSFSAPLLSLRAS